ncbi:hypothetical protein Q2E61_14260 [Microbulbifer thermotolerans]|uniref:hypothetical protein n=1 Tax=Microbulbifer thermotolerans TaxID=252514 RepID=UPI0022489760|nr:hypothetical protein [Microbulbifer thermotolerans]MCX2796411.1 hypothetical protein [Microbulbifer thermotolerans]WKT60057.1 hypothetical protein Q2E61_14260 [Microbulbifer thermotolerans]
MEDELSIRLQGEGVKPGLIRSKEIAEILEAVEEMAIAEAIKFDPTLHRDEIIVGFYAIEDKSIGLRFKTTFTATVLSAFVSAAQAVEKQDFESLTPQSLNSLRLISGFSKKHSCNAIIGSGLSEELATITPNTVIPSPTFISGRTEVLGRVIRVGGKTPKAMIELVDGTTLYCEVPEDIAKELGHRLYSLAKFEGYAKWDSKTLDFEDLKIYSVKEFPNDDPTLVLREIGSLVGNYLGGMGDVVEFVSTLRNDGGVEE